MVEGKGKKKVPKMQIVKLVVMIDDGRDELMQVAITNPAEIRKMVSETLWKFLVAEVGGGDV